MFSYYGSKSKIIDLYPRPKYRKIIEPFAGSARYSLRYFENEVLLIDKYEIIVRVWKYLQQCSMNDILKLPKFNKGEDVRMMNLSDEEKWFMGFNIARGNFYPSNVGGNFNSWESDKKRVAKDLFKIKHWEIKCGCYLEVENQLASWFIDPPYQFGGHKYKFSNKRIEFNNLSIWCKERMGQSIVCENTKANWMDFKPIIKMRGGQTTTTEAIWSNVATPFDYQQGKLL